AKLREVASRGPMSSAKWTMSRMAARASIAGRGVADCWGLEVAVPGEGAGVLPFAAGGVLVAKVEESVSGGPGGGGEQQGPRTIKESAASRARPIHRHYVAESPPLLGHPNVLPDRKTQRRG
ncbi:MAG TPA: hypothetical protein VI030_09005, partial [Propionibacteriaceae bacterium]